MEDMDKIATALGLNEPEEFDPVNRPEHYMKGHLECIDWIEAELSPEEFKGYLKGNALKYIWRYEDKGNPVQDIRKAIWYLGKLSSVLMRDDSQKQHGA